MSSTKKYKFKDLDPIKPTIAYDTYWRFAHKRQEIFLKRIRGETSNLSDDEILTTYKFTNAYRACDRVSQYLIKEVIYSETFDVEDMFLRILLFKLFNKIDTWRLLEERFGTICSENFNIQKFSDFLDSEMNKGRVLYSSAYMMASGSKEFDVTRKHHAHFMLLDMMLKDRLPDKIHQSPSMAEAYRHILAYPLIGQFLAYQYITDINYSEITDFSESEFTVPGPGARDGIRKCFHSLGGVSESELIKILADRQEYEFERLGLEFHTLGGRALQYIDIQNIFCETDKYCRVAHPEIVGISGRTRIKQLFKINDKPINYFFPPKWKINMELLHGKT
ncbi:MAG: nucleotide kinase domain-containing protein [Neptuniibacter sp.]